MDIRGNGSLLEFKERSIHAKMISSEIRTYQPGKTNANIASTERRNGALAIFGKFVDLTGSQKNTFIPESVMRNS